MTLSWANVTKSFGPLCAVDGLTLRLEPGEVFGLLGPNGAGKSTSIAMAVGLLRPDTGEVRIDGSGDPADPSVRRSIGLAPQTLSLYEELSAAENLAFACEIYGIRGPALKRRADELLDFVGLADRRAGRVSTFSGGMKRRLNFAGALVHDPAILLLDEPTAGVDPQSRNALFDLVRHQRAAGKTILYTTHYMEEAQKLCDRAAIMDRGRILALGTVPELLAAHGGGSVVTAVTAEGERRIPTPDPMTEVARLYREGSVSSLRIDGPDLEAVFLNLTGRALRDEA